MSVVTDWIENALISLVNREPKLRPRSRRRRPTNTARHHRCRSFEPLESRQMLAADIMSQIGGTVFSDLTDNGLTSDDVAIAGASIRLSRDGGDGRLGNDDTLVETTITDNSGGYLFRGLTEGRYFVEQIAKDGFVNRSGGSVRTIDISADAADGNSGRTIDNFGTTQTILASSLATRKANIAMRDSAVLGGERDLYVEVLSGRGNVSLESGFLGLGVLQFSSNGNAVSTATVTWDGADGNARSVDATGLGGIDLTEEVGNPMTGFRLLLGADQLGADLSIIVHTDDANWSQAKIIIPDTGGAADDRFTIGFNEFSVGGGAGADFSNVGAVQLILGSGTAAVDSQIALTGTVGPTLFDADFANVKMLSLGDLVWVDIDNDGVFDAGTEKGIANVLIELLEDSDGSGDYTKGVDTFLASETTDAEGRFRFDRLLPGDFVVKLAETNFGTTGPLRGLASSKQNALAPDPDNDTNNDDNGYPIAANSIVSRAIVLSAGAEPTNDGDSDDASNLTVDFGLFGFDLVLSKKVNGIDGPLATAPGDALTYTIVVTNAGPSTATDVKLTDGLPNGVSFQSGRANRGGLVTANAGELTANLGKLAAGESTTVTIQGVVDSSAKGTLVNTARVSAPNETNLTNNSDDAVIRVTPKIDLEIVKDESTDPVTPGEVFSYTLRITNNGPSDATDVTVVDTLPTGSVTFLDASQTASSKDGNDLVFQLGDIAARDSRSLTINVRVNDDVAGGVLTNTARVAANEQETTLVNNDAAEQTTVKIPPASVAGFVYVDTDDDGTFDANEQPLAGVTLVLSGTANDGSFVTRTTVTATDGSYLFDNLKPDFYRIEETQPGRYKDGQESLGTTGGIVGRLGANSVEENNDTFDSIELGGGDVGTRYNFGELAVTISKRDFL